MSRDPLPLSEPHIVVSYTLDGPALDPDEVTLRTGIAPDAITKRGAPIVQGGRMMFNRGSWTLHRFAHEAHEADDVVASLIAELDPRKAVFLEFADVHDATFTVSVATRESHVGIGFMRDLLAAVTSYRAGLQIGVRQLPGEHETA